MAKNSKLQNGLVHVQIPRAIFLQGEIYFQSPFLKFENVDKMQKCIKQSAWDKSPSEANIEFR